MLPERGDEVVEDPQRRLLRPPGADELGRRLQLDALAARERVVDKGRILAEVRDDEVAGEPEAVQRDAAAPRDLLVDDGEQDRQAEPALEHQVEHRVVRVVVVGLVPGEAVTAPDQGGERVALLPRREA